MKIFVWVFVLIISTASIAESLGRRYYINFMGHIHENPSKDSTSVTVIQCSHSLKIQPVKNKIPGWTYVSVGDDKGYIQSKYLSDKRPDCLQAKYPKFYNSLQLDITEMYFWARLYDHYTLEKSMVR